VNYEPNTIAGGMPKEAPVMPGEHYHLEGEVQRKSITLINDFEQAGERYRSLGKADQDHLVDNIVDDLSKAGKPIQRRMLTNLSKVDPEFGTSVEKGIKL
jgi:catalase